MPLNQVNTHRRTRMKAKRFETAKGTDVASAGSIALPNNGNVVTLTGTTAVDYIKVDGWQAGSRISLIANGTGALNHNTGTVPTGYAALFNASAGNITTAANKAYSYIYNGTLWIQD